MHLERVEREEVEKEKEREEVESEGESRVTDLMIQIFII